MDPDDDPPAPSEEVSLQLAAALHAVFAEAAIELANDPLYALFAAAGEPFDRQEAAVTLETDGDPALVGVRAASLLDDRQIVAEAEGMTVVLDLARRGAGSDGTLSVRGEVVGTDEALSVQLLDAGIEVALTVTDEFGEFRLDDLAPGRYELIVAGAHREVSLFVTLD